MIENDCGNCTKPCKTPNSDYYTIDQIKYCRTQLFFLIEHLEILRDGQYPSAHIETGYTNEIDPSIRVQPSQQAPFVNPALIYADVTSRLEACGEDGRTLEHEIVSLHAEYYEELSGAARNALNYCSGWKRRRQGYLTWMREQRRKNTQKRVFANK